MIEALETAVRHWGHVCIRPPVAGIELGRSMGWNGGGCAHRAGAPTT